MHVYSVVWPRAPPPYATHCRSATSARFRRGAKPHRRDAVEGEGEDSDRCTARSYEGGGVYVCGTSLLLHLGGHAVIFEARKPIPVCLLGLLAHLVLPKGVAVLKS